MSPEELAARQLRTLIAELRDDRQAIERLLPRLLMVRERVASSETPDPGDVMAIAGFLHHIYTAMESMHERVVAYVDRVPPSGERWHHELLARISVDIEGVRPALLSTESRAQLSRLLRFRHFFRHAYRIDLLWVEVKPLADDVAAILDGYRRDLEVFIRHLEAAMALAASG